MILINENVDTGGKVISDNLTKDKKKLKDHERNTFDSGNIFESLARTNPELFNREKLKLIEASQNIIKDFNEYMTIVFGKDLDRLESFIKSIENETNNKDIDSKFRANFNIVLYRGLYSQYNMLKDKGVKEEDIYNALLTNYLPEASDENQLRSIIKLRLDNNKCLSDSLNTMLKQNYKLLNITKAEATSLCEKLNDDKSNDEAMKKLKEILSDKKLLDKFRSNGKNYDFRSIGGAYVILSDSYDIQSEHVASKIMHYIFKYDCIVCSHGGTVQRHVDKGDKVSSINRNEDIHAKDIRYSKTKDLDGIYVINNAFSRWIKIINNDDDKILRKCYTLMIAIYKDDHKYIGDLNVRDMCEYYVENIKKLAGRYPYLVDDDYAEVLNTISNMGIMYEARKDPKSAFRDNRVKDWICQPVNTLTRSDLEQVIDILRTLKEEGFKNVLLQNCNPSGITLPRDIKNDKDFNVRYALTSHLKENSLIIDNAIEEISILEESLNEYSKILNSPYEFCTLYELQNEYNKIINKIDSLNEGFTDKLKEFCKKAVQIVIEIWKRLIGFIKNLFINIKDRLFHGLKGQKIKKPIKVSTISISGNKAHLEEKECKTMEEVIQTVENSTKSIKNCIETHMKREVECMRRYDAILDRNRKAYGNS